MPNSTSSKTYILLAAIATLAIAAVASQVAAAPTPAVSGSPSRVWGSCGALDIWITNTVAVAHEGYTLWFTHVGDRLQVFGPGDDNYGRVDFFLDSPVLIAGPHANLTVQKYDWGWFEEGLIFDNETTLAVSDGMDFPPEAEGRVVIGVFIRFATYGDDYAGGPHGYIGYGSPGNVWSQIGTIDLGGELQCDVAAPVATAIPQLALPCITGTTGLSATVQPTMTPYGRTTTPIPTRTPGGPSPTPTAMVTATVRPVSGTASYDSGLITFDNDVNQLSAVGVVNEGPNQFLQWSNAPGNDGRPGVAMLHAGMGDVYTVTAQEMTLGSVVAVFKTGGYVGPVAVSLYARNAYTLTVGNQHSLRVWYLDPDYNGPGQGVWITTQSVPSNLGLSNVWRKLGAVVQPTGGSGKISAIAFSDERLNVNLSESLPPCPSGRGCIYIDDLRIAYGASAGLVLPFCDGTDPNGLRNGRQGRACIINLKTIDLRAVCQAPTTLDLGAWLSYLWCNIWRFFGFFQENRDQVDAIIARQALNEPFGSLSETGAVYDDLNTSVEQLRQSNKSQVQNPIDWVATFMDGSALDHLPQFTMPDIASSAQYMASCPAEAMFSTSTATGACMALYMMRQTVIVTLFQWGLNALFVVGTLMLIRGDLEKLAS